MPKCYWPYITVILPDKEKTEFIITPREFDIHGDITAYNICCEDIPKDLIDADKLININNTLNRDPNDDSALDTVIGDSIIRTLWMVINDQILPKNMDKLARRRKLGERVKINIKRITFKETAPHNQKFCSCGDTKKAWINLFCEFDGGEPPPPPPPSPDPELDPPPSPKPLPDQQPLPPTPSQEIIFYTLNYTNPCTDAEDRARLKTKNSITTLGDARNLGNINDINIIKKKIWKFFNDNPAAKDRFNQKFIAGIGKTNPSGLKFTLEEMTNFAKESEGLSKLTHSFPDNELANTEIIKLDNQNINTKITNTTYRVFQLEYNYGKVLDGLFISNTQFSDLINLVSSGRLPQQNIPLLYDGLLGNMILPKADKSNDKFFNIKFNDRINLEIPLSFKLSLKPYLGGRINFTLKCYCKDKSLDPDPCNIKENSPKKYIKFDISNRQILTCNVSRQQGLPGLDEVEKATKVDYSENQIAATNVILTSNPSFYYTKHKDTTKFLIIDEKAIPDSKRIVYEYATQPKLYNDQDHNNLVDTDPTENRSEDNKPIASIIFTENADDTIRNEIIAIIRLAIIKNAIERNGIKEPRVTEQIFGKDRFFNTITPKDAVQLAKNSSYLPPRYSLVDNDDKKHLLMYDNVNDIHSLPVNGITGLAELLSTFKDGTGRTKLLPEDNPALDLWLRERYSTAIENDSEGKAIRSNGKVPLSTEKKAAYSTNFTNGDNIHIIDQIKNTILNYNPDNSVPFNIELNETSSTNPAYKFFDDPKLLPKELKAEIKRILELKDEAKKYAKEKCCCCYWTLDEDQPDLTYNLSIEVAE
jgi:hypothetical protein